MAMKIEGKNFISLQISTLRDFTDEYMTTALLKACIKFKIL